MLNRILFFGMWFVVGGIILIGCAAIIELIIVPHLGDESKFVKWWRRHFISDQDLEPKN